MRLIEIEIKSWFELARFLNRFIARFFSAPPPPPPPPQPPAVCYPIQSEQRLNWAREQNRPGIQTDSMLKKQGKMSSEQDKDWWPKKMHVSCRAGNYEPALDSGQGWERHSWPWLGNWIHGTGNDTPGVTKKLDPRELATEVSHSRQAWLQIGRHGFWRSSKASLFI